MADITDIHALDQMVLEADHQTGDRAALADRLLAMAEKLPPGPGSLRAEILVAASEQFRETGDRGRAVDPARKAVADGGEAFDARVPQPRRGPSARGSDRRPRRGGGRLGRRTATGNRVP